ncbi:MAG TPA: molybdate ABC transporter permease subunit [Candidatus Acidoferrales bacterium]|nr:molybdate ABC transporter permease subunit [Candidatus Acidoferrales bacterium]
MDLSPILLSLETSVAATATVTLLGTLAAGWRVRHRGAAFELLDGVFLLPLVLPPTVVGFLLLLLLGRASTLGNLLYGLGLRLVFSWYAAVIAAAVTTFPLMYMTARAALEQVETPLVEVARTLGAGEARIFRQILLPLAWPGLAAGMVLTFARALGDFGATLILAGNIPGKTQTLPLAIFFAVEAGDTEEAVRWSLVTVAISLAALGALNLWTRHRTGLSMRVVQQD